jgi:hypothetical protein
MFQESLPGGEDEFSERIFTHMNIRNWLTRSHLLNRENRTRNHSKSCECKLETQTAITGLKF